MGDSLTLDNYVSVEVWLVTEPPRSTMVIVSRDSKSLIKPLSKKPIRELRPGDLVRFQGERRIIESIAPYR